MQAIVLAPAKDRLCEDVEVYYKTVNVYKFSREFSANEYYEPVLRLLLQLQPALHP